MLDKDCDDPATVPVAALLPAPPLPVDDAVCEADGDVPLVVPATTDVEAAVDAPVFWLVLEKADVEKRLVEACIPDQVVLPITVTVVGCDAPNLTASLPEEQSQSGSPGQQYQSSPSDVLHLARGIDVLLSEKAEISIHAMEQTCRSTDFLRNTILDIAESPRFCRYMYLYSMLASKLYISFD